MKRRNLEPSKTPCDIYQLHPEEPFWCGVLLLFSCFNCPFLFQALCKVELFQNSWKTLFELHRPEWALGLLHFLLFPHDCVWLQQERNVVFIHESFWNQRWPPSKDTYSGQSHAQNYFLYLSSPSSSERSLSIWEVAREKSFYCCSV